MQSGSLSDLIVPLPEIYSKWKRLEVQDTNVLDLEAKNYYTDYNSQIAEAFCHTKQAKFAWW